MLSNKVKSLCQGTSILEGLIVQSSKFLKYKLPFANCLFIFHITLFFYPFDNTQLPIPTPHLPNLTALFILILYTPHQSPLVCKTFFFGTHTIAVAVLPYKIITAAFFYRRHLCYLPCSIVFIHIIRL